MTDQVGALDGLEFTRRVKCVLAWRLGNIGHGTVVFCTALESALAAPDTDVMPATDTYNRCFYDKAHRVMQFSASSSDSCLPS